MTTTETVPGSDLAARVEQLIHEGTVRQITVEHDGHTIARFPVAVGAVGALEHVDLARRYETERLLRVRLEALHQASLAIASAHTPAQILQRLVDVARELIGARYAALGVLSPQGVIEQFYTAGISEEERARIGPLPQGHGLLGVTLSEGTTLRLPDVAQDPRSVGFPPGHPVMHSLLALPVAHGAAVVGNLYLADKVGAREFSPEDEHLLTLLAEQAAVVIEKARLAEKARTLAVVAERNRIGQDVHDRVIQPIYAVTLELESAAEEVGAAPAVARERIDVVIDQLGEVIKNMRRHILGVQAVSTADQTLPEALAVLLAETRAETLLETDLSVHGEEVHDLPAPLAQDLLQIAREAVTNVVRHARASRVGVILDVREQEVHLTIRDNGSDCATRNAPASGYYGWRSLQEWARGLGGAVTIQSTRGQGTVVEVRVPVAMPERAAGPRGYEHGVVISAWYQHQAHRSQVGEPTAPERPDDARAATCQSHG